MKLHSRVCDILNIEKPIVLAGMGGASCPALAAAVSNAGGLGVLGAASCGPKQLRQWIRETKELTDKPFGVDKLLPASVRRANYEEMDGPTPADLLPDRQSFAKDFMEREGLELAEAPSVVKRDKDEPAMFTAEFFDAQMEVIIQEGVPDYASGLGNPGPWMDGLRANGTKVMAVVGAVRHAIQVKSSGVDIIVAQGHDGGGHHMGGTRVGINSNDSVVDKNLKVHGVDNLFLAGSSVFASAGYSNPTFTIVQLSLRLGIMKLN